MLYPKRKLAAGYLRRVAKTLSASIEGDERSFENKKKEALHNIKLDVEQINIYLGKMEKASDIKFEKSNGEYFLDIDFTGDIQGYLNKIKEEIKNITEKHSKLQREIEK